MTSAALVATDIAVRLACPRCHRGLVLRDGTACCGLCGTVGTFRGDVISFEAGPRTPSYFDERVDELNTTTHNNWAFSYAQQVSLLESYLREARTVLDLGCGSRSPYERRPDAFIIGVDPSMHALQANKCLNLRLHTNAVRLPLASGSIDLAVCFYSLHHMIGDNIDQTRANVTRCLRECSRVLVPGGTLFIAENNPRSFFWLLQRWGWSFARKTLGRHVDMFFWSQRELDRLLLEATGRRAARTVTCDAGPLAVISPAFAVPQLKIFGFMHPLNRSVSIWTKATPSVSSDP